MLAITTLGLAIAAGVAPAAAQRALDRRVILVTFDGVRPIDFFGGLDTVVAGADKRLSGVSDSAALWRDYWRDTPEARRRAVMPFLWDSLAPRGMIFGNRARRSLARILNGHGFSAPGYLEILTGVPQSDVTSNDRVRYPHRTVLEIVREQDHLPPSQVALFGSWENFREYASSIEGLVTVSSGYDTLPSRLTTPAIRNYQRLNARDRALWDGSRLDVFTGALGLEYLRVHQPRLIYFSFNDTDDLAHSRRYDRVLMALHSLDDFLKELVQLVDSLPAYRGHTTIILTTDHGRGHGAEDWTDHGEKVRGSEEIWLGVFGPDTPQLGEVADQPDVFQAQVAGTILLALGLDPALLGDGSAPPIRAALGQ